MFKHSCSSQPESGLNFHPVKTFPTFLVAQEFYLHFNPGGVCFIVWAGWEYLGALLTVAHSYSTYNSPLD